MFALISFLVDLVESIIWLIILSIPFGCVWGAICRNINKRKYRDGGFWLGFFLGWLGLIICIARPKQELNKRKSEIKALVFANVPVESIHPLWQSYYKRLVANKNNHFDVILDRMFSKEAEELKYIAETPIVK